MAARAQSDRLISIERGINRTGRGLVTLNNVHHDPRSLTFACHCCAMFRNHAETEQAPGNVNHRGYQRVCTCLERDIFVARRYRTSVMEIPDESRERHKCHGNCEGARRNRRGILYSSPGVGLRQVVWHIFIFSISFSSFSLSPPSTLFPSSLSPRSCRVLYLHEFTDDAKRNNGDERPAGKIFRGYFLSYARNARRIRTMKARTSA